MSTHNESSRVVGPVFTIETVLLPSPARFDLKTALLEPGPEQPKECQNLATSYPPRTYTDDQLWSLRFAPPDTHGSHLGGLQQGSSAEPRWSFHDYVVSSQIPFVDMVQQLCCLSRVRNCQYEGCLNMKQLMHVAPPCRWTQFREWLLTAYACRLNAIRLRAKSRQYWPWIEKTLEHLVENVERMPRQKTFTQTTSTQIDPYEILELIYWVTLWELNNGMLSHDFRPQQLYRSRVFGALQTAQNLGVCQKRLWNLALGSAREQDDLPALISFAHESSHIAPYLKHREPEARGSSSDHRACTAEFCEFDSINSTSVRQLHKCRALDCDKLHFPSPETQSPNMQFTWWLDSGRRSRKQPRIAEEKYMAISHVWSDGTGAGVQEPGHVNRCLFEFFQGIARSLECEAIWWDTISIPRERKARARALRRMHESYEQATHTVVHDRYLLQFPWADDGSPCLALVLSPWFTRGWTALELIRSKNHAVWILFGDPKNPGQHVIKNLEKDVLASLPAKCSLGHLIASSIVKRLRDKQIRQLEDILAVLNTRSTSWPQDRMIIAGLLAYHPVKLYTSNLQVRLTQEILSSFVEIPAQFLLHGHSPMTEKGGFSWCPSTLFDGPILRKVSVPDLLYLDERGAISGAWKYHLLELQDVNKIQPYGSHLSADWHIRMALQNWQNCLVLRPLYSDLKPSPALLVTMLDVGQWSINDHMDPSERVPPRCVLDCQYVGTVYEELAWPMKVQKISIRLGMSFSRPCSSGRKLLERYDWRGDVPQALVQFDWVIFIDLIRRKRMDAIAQITDVP